MSVSVDLRVYSTVEVDLVVKERNRSTPVSYAIPTSQYVMLDLVGEYVVERVSGRIDLW